ncbi:MAG TPA: hypothetical protein VGG28_21645 [Kofleriaceae bacterium]|jgi:hypothetical protein
MRSAIVVLACASCAYDAGSYRDLNTIEEPWPGAHVVLACLDVAILRVHDAVAPDPAFAFHFGNRCNHRVEIDLAAVRVVAGERVLAPYDPQHELVPHRLPARWTGYESIGYEPDRGATRVCVDVGKLERGTHRDGAVRCFGGDVEVAP